MSYHINQIPNGEYGKLSKVVEELHELKDSIQQNNRIMSLCELSDILGAMDGCFGERINLQFQPSESEQNIIKEVYNLEYEFPDTEWVDKLLGIVETEASNEFIAHIIQCMIVEYLIVNFKTISIHDVLIMSDRTKIAFETGYRKSK